MSNSSSGNTRYPPGIIALFAHTVFAVFKVLYVVFWSPGLFFEEAQYWLWSKFLDWSYYSKPPLIAWVNFTSSSFLGDSELGIRINAIFCGWLTGWFVYRLAHDITRDQVKAMWASISLIAFPYFWITSLFFTTDSLVMTCWIAAFYFLYRYVQGSRIAVFQMGLVLGLGILSKYVMAIFVPFVLTYLYLYHREYLRKWHLYAALLIAVAMCLPIVYWNHVHEWVTFQHVGTLANSDGPGAIEWNKIPGRLLEYIFGQFVAWMWVLFLPFIRGFRALFRVPIPEATFLLLAPVFVVFWLFFFIGFQSHVEVNWTFFALPTLSVFVGLAISSVRQLKVKLAVITSLLILVLFLPVIDRRMNIPISVNPFKRLTGWKSFAGELDTYLRTLDNEYYLIADNYGTASLLAFYLDRPPKVFSYSPEKRMNQFAIWSEKYHPMLRHKPAVFIGLNRNIPTEGVGDVLDTTKLWLHVSNADRLEYSVVVYDEFNVELHQHKGY